MFDTSGSFYKEALPACLDLTETIFSTLISDNTGLGIYPQIHQVVSIDEQSVKIGKNCSIKILQKNIFRKSTNNIDLDHCLSLIRNKKSSSYTNLSGALLNASNAFQGQGFYGKGLIIFSDLHEDIPRKKKFRIDLTGVSVFIIHEYSKEQLRDPDLFHKDKQSLISLLVEAGCNESDIIVRNLKSVINTPEDIVLFFRKSFKNSR
jgi:hypothetical protein